MTPPSIRSRWSQKRTKPRSIHCSALNPIHCQLLGVTLEPQSLGVTFYNKTSLPVRLEYAAKPQPPAFSFTLSALNLDIQTDTGEIHLWKSFTCTPLHLECWDPEEKDSTPPSPSFHSVTITQTSFFFFFKRGQRANAFQQKASISVILVKPV